MSSAPFVKSNPSVLVKIFDAIVTCQKTQQQPSLSNILKETENADAEHTLRLAVEDALLLVSGKDTYAIPRVDQSPIFRYNHDSFCHTCHQSGLVLECETCWRVSHAGCCPVDAPTTKGKFICSMCKQLRAARPSPLDLKQLNRLLIFIICILRERFREHSLDPDRMNNAVYKVLMFKYASFETIEEKIVNNSYTSPLDFLGDIQSMFHCFVLASGSELCTMADLLYNYAHYELDELENCPTCYLLSNTKPENWFSIPCNPPHRLVYAKQKGYSYWPAKIVKPQTEESNGFDDNNDDANSFDVRYFGGNHERAFIELDCLKPIETDVSKLVPKRTAALSKALEELSLHQQYLTDGPSKYAPIVQSLYLVTNWRAEIEQEKLKKCLPLQGTGSNNKAKRARGKSVTSASHRSTPTPTNSNSVTADGDSRDASVSELVNPTESPAVIPVKEVVPPTKALSSNRRSVKNESEKQIKQPVSLEKLNPPVVMKQTNGEAKPTRSATRSSLPSPKSNEPAAKRQHSPPSRSSQRNQEVVPNLSQTLSPVPVTTPLPVTTRNTPLAAPSNAVLKQQEAKPEPTTRTVVSAHHHRTSSSLSHQQPVNQAKVETTSPLPQPAPILRPTGPCPPGSLCAESYERKLAETKREFETKIKQMQEKFEIDRRNDLQLTERRFAEETAKFQKQQAEEIAAVKKKQWCVNCSQEAFFPCCWNTAYCSQHCQQEHWYHEHKKFCRRRRNQEQSNSTAGSNTSSAAGNQSSGAQMQAAAAPSGS